MLRRVVTLVGALASSTLVSAQTAPSDPPGGAAHASPAEQTDDVRFRNEHDDRMTVSVRLSGGGPYRFLVDTGADRTAVSRELVSRLRLPAASSAALHSVTGVTTVSTAKVRGLEFAKNPEQSVEAVVLDGEHMGADGIVGVDVLRSQRVQFDFEKQTMSIVPSKAPERRTEAGTIVVEAKRKNGRLIVTNASANGQSVTVVIDTGSQVSIGNRALRQKLLNRDLIKAVQTVELESVTGEKIGGEYVFVRELEVGGIRLKNLPIVFADAHTFKQLQLDGKPALLLGMNAIRAFKKVSIDFANRKFRVVLPEESALGVQYAAAGLH